MKRVSKYINFGISWYAIVSGLIVKADKIMEINLENFTCFIVTKNGEWISDVRLADLYNTKGEAELALKNEQK